MLGQAVGIAQRRLEDGAALPEQPATTKVLKAVVPAARLDQECRPPQVPPVGLGQQVMLDAAEGEDLGGGQATQLGLQPLGMLLASPTAGRLNQCPELLTVHHRTAAPSLSADQSSRSPDGQARRGVDAVGDGDDHQATRSQAQ